MIERKKKLIDRFSLARLGVKLRSGFPFRTRYFFFSISVIFTLFITSPSLSSLLREGLPIDLAKFVNSVKILIDIRHPSSSTLYLLCLHLFLYLPLCYHLFSLSSTPFRSLTSLALSLMTFAFSLSHFAQLQLRQLSSAAGSAAKAAAKAAHSAPLPALPLGKVNDFRSRERERETGQRQR